MPRVATPGVTMLVCRFIHCVTDTVQGVCHGFIDSLLDRLPAGFINSLLHGCIASLIHASLIHIIVGRSFDSLLPSWIHRCIAQVVLSLHTCPIDSLLHLVFRLLLHYVIDSLLHLLFQPFIRMNARNLSGVCLALLCRPVWCALSAPFRREK